VTAPLASFTKRNSPACQLVTSVEELDADHRPVRCKVHSKVSADLDALDLSHALLERDVGDVLLQVVRKLHGDERSGLARVRLNGQ